MKPSLENIILENLSYHDEISSNKLHQKLKVNKKRYTDTKNHMITQGYIKEEINGNRKYLSRLDFEDEKFQQVEFTTTIKTNCNYYMKNLKKIKPIAISRKDKFILKKKVKVILDALFIQLDKIHTICIRLEYAKTFGLMNKTRAKHHRNKCLELFDEIMNELFFDHKKFKLQIINHYQSQIRILKFKV